MVVDYPYFSGSQCPVNVFPPLNPTYVIDNIYETFIAAGSSAGSWNASSMPAFIIGTFSGNPSNGQTLQIGTTIYTFTSTAGGIGASVSIGATLADTINTLAAHINGVNVLVTAVAWDSTTITLNAIALGGDGNYISVTGIGTWGYGTATPGTGVPSGFNKTLFGGWKFKYRSPQGLYFQVNVWDNGPTYWSVGSVRFQCVSVTNPSIQGIVHSINVPTVTGAWIQCLVNGGGFFISNAGIGTTGGFGNVGTSCCGGLLYYFKFGHDPTPTEAWWSMGDGGGTGTYESPRTNLYWNLWPNNPAMAEACWNGNYVGGISDPTNNAVPVIMPRNSATQEMVNPIQMWNGDPVIYNPYLCWGDASGFPRKLRGIIPDARIYSLQLPPDGGMTDDLSSLTSPPVNTTYTNYTANYIKGTLQLKATPINAIIPVTPATPPQPFAFVGKPFNIGSLNK